MTLAFQMVLSIILMKYGLHRKIRIVTRLDKDTSGIVVVAKCDYIQDMLTMQMQDNIFKKEYIGILDGIVEPKSGTIDAPIARKDDSIIERCISENGQKSITHYKATVTKENMSILHFILETGRTHQIRVHSKYIGHPIVGDTLYGIPSSLISRQALHAYKINFIHPITKKEVQFIADLPKDMSVLIEKQN